ncbi:MAG: hypothetical protein LBO66_06840 [Deltaproteobacteria bacterium]|jgi:hypothetical protein|nr:hypothetical protein [Deltaproteobacteria bacterium]
MAKNGFRRVPKRLGQGLSSTVLACSLALLLVSGCIGQGLPTHKFTVNYYQKCYEPIKQLRDNEDKLKGDVMKGVAAGAMAGFITVLIASDGNWRAALLGAVIGAAAGATVAYLVSNEIQSQEQEARFAAYNETMDVDISNISMAVKSARLARACYDREYKALERNYKAGRVPQPEMVERLAELRDGMGEVTEVLKKYNDVTLANVETYDNIIVAENKRTPDQDKLNPQNLQTVTKKRGNAAKLTRDADAELTLCGNLFNLMDRRSLEVQNAGNGFAPVDYPALVDSSECVPCSLS